MNLLIRRVAETCYRLVITALDFRSMLFYLEIKRHHA